MMDNDQSDEHRNTIERQSQLLAVLRKEIAVGIEQAERGQFVNGEEAFNRIRQLSRYRR